MSAAFAAPAHGSSVAPEIEAEFLDSLLRIRDDVLAGRHPRITLPPATLEQLARSAAPPPPPPAVSRPSINGSSSSNPSISTLPPRPGGIALSFQTSEEHRQPVPQAPRPFPKSASGIDPVLLTKSDALIKAELQLKRQTIERAIKDASDKRGRGKDTSDEDTSLDVVDALTKAQALVKPVSGLRPSVPASDGSSSFDENSYYSSKADSWSPDENESRQSVRSANATEAVTTQSRTSPAAELTAAKPTAPAPQQQAQPMVIDLEEEAYEPADDIEIYEPEPAQGQADQEESDYSPPPAAAGPSEPNRGRVRDRGDAHRSLNG